MLVELVDGAPLGTGILKLAGSYDPSKWSLANFIIEKQLQNDYSNKSKFLAIGIAEDRRRNKRIAAKN